jgi:serine/threonine protein kinase
MALAPGTRLGPYEILGPIGAGGMGEVYRARDGRLRRDVALKIVPETLAQSPEALARFEREAQTVAALSHPNIVAIFDVGREKQVRYLVMELLEGETLRERLASGPLPVRTAIELALQVARGLAEAHAKGMVHRDLKPENLLLARGGLVKILDFGLARLVEDSDSADQEGAPTPARGTSPGTLLGTVGYMAPEQARGHSSDARSDLFALGAVLCEMLTGERAFGGTSRADTLSATLRDEPRGLGWVGTHTPPGLGSIIERCLRKSPDERFQSAREVIAALEVLVVSSSSSGHEPDTDRTVTMPSIAVLPLANIGSDPDTEYFSDGMTEEIINALAHLEGLRVAARTSSFAFKGQNQDLREIARKLDVSAVLEGSVRRAGNRLRITAQLIDAKGGHHLWSERYDREIADVFAIQDEIAQAIAARLKVALVAPQGERPEPPTRDTEAYDLYLKGRHFFNRRSASQAIAKFEAALARDPDFAPAYTGLADSYGIHGFYGGIDTRLAYARGWAAAERARKLAPESSEVNVSLGILEHYFGWDFEEEERELSEAMRRSPRSAAPRYWLSLLYGLRGRLEEALPLAREAAHLEPLSPYTVSVAGWSLLTARRMEEACAEFRRGLEVDPNAVLQLFGLSRSLQAQGDVVDALAAAERLVAVTAGGPSLALGVLAQAYAFAGQAGEARRVLSELKGRASREYVAPIHLAPAFVALGDLDAAFQACERACVERNALTWWFVLYDPGLDALRSDPRFSALAARVVPARAG